MSSSTRPATGACEARPPGPAGRRSLRPGGRSAPCFGSCRPSAVVACCSTRRSSTRGTQLHRVRRAQLAGVGRAGQLQGDVQTTRTLCTSLRQHAAVGGRHDRRPGRARAADRRAEPTASSGGTLAAAAVPAAVRALRRRRSASSGASSCRPDGAGQGYSGFFGLPGAEHAGGCRRRRATRSMMIVAVDLAGGRRQRPAVRGRHAVDPGRADRGGPARRRHGLAGCSAPSPGRCSGRSPRSWSVCRMVGSLKTFDIVWVMTQGRSRAASSETLALTMYKETFVLQRVRLGLRGRAVPHASSRRRRRSSTCATSCSGAGDSR